MHTRNRQRGMGFFSVVFLIVGLLVAAGVWKHFADSARKERAAAEQARQVAEQQAAKSREEAQKRRDDERRAYADALQQHNSRVASADALKTLSGIHRRWSDGIKVAINTPQFALPGPINVLQAVRRDAEMLQVPPCLVEPKKKLVAGMNKVIEVFVQFMGSAEAGRELAANEVGDIRMLFSDYESAARSCLVD